MKHNTARIQRSAVPRLDVLQEAVVLETSVPRSNLHLRSRPADFGLPLLLLLAGGALQAASVIQFSATLYNVTEGTPQVEIAVQRTDDLDTVVSLDFATTNGTATAGADYLDVSTNLTFLAGQTNQTVAVPILNDGLVEGLEAFQVLLSNPTGGAELGARSNATVRITDNDKSLQIEFAKYQVREDEGSVLIGVLRGDDGNFPVIVEYATADGTATAGLDYTPTSGKLEFAAGETLKLLTIPILNDGLKEANETFRVYLTNAAGTVLASPTSATITILDNDPGVQFEFNTYWVQENEGALAVQVLRGNDVDWSAFTVDYATTNLTATAGQDYAETRGTLAFAEGETVKVLTIPITDDQLAEPDEKFTIILSNPTGSAVLGKIATATVTILDTTGMAPHRFDALTILEDRSVQLTLGGGVHRRFKDYYDLYPIEVSSNLVDWTPLVTLQRTNSSTNAFTYTDPEVAKSGMRFYRTVTNHLITPLRPPSGPFPVGMAWRMVTDPSRRNRYWVSTNGSFMVSIWYPAVAKAGILPGPIDAATLMQDPTVYYSGALMDKRRYLMCYAMPNAPAEAAQAPWPVVLVSPGLTDARNYYEEQGANLASQGYVVVSADHWDAEGTVYPDGTYLKSHVTANTSSISTAGFQDRVKDLLLVLDRLDGWNKSDPAFAGRLDLDRVATMGHSWGGGVAGELGRTDARVKAVILLDAYLQNADDLVRLGLSKPFLGMYSTEVGGDSTLYNHKSAQRAIWFMISPSMHNQFTDISWAGFPNDIAGNREITRTIEAYTLWFLNKYLKGLDEPMPTKADYPRITGFKQK